MVALMNGEHDLAAASVIAEMASASKQEVKNAIVDCIDDAGDWHATEVPYRKQACQRHESSVQQLFLWLKLAINA